jgi:hypothetical protein
MFIFTYETRYIPVHTADLHDVRCPLCGQTGVMHMHYQQVEQDGVVWQRMNKLVAQAQCASCGKELTQRQWTQAMASEFERAKRDIKLETFTKLGSTGQRALLVVAACFIFVAALFAANKIGWLKLLSSKSDMEVSIDQTNSYRAAPAVGDVALVMVSELNNGRAGATRYTLYKLVEVQGDTLRLAPHKSSVSSLSGNWVSLGMSDADFDRSKTIGVPRKLYQSARLGDYDRSSTQVSSVYLIQRPGT